MALIKRQKWRDGKILVVFDSDCVLKDERLAEKENRDFLQLPLCFLQLIHRRVESIRDLVPSGGQ